MEDERYIEMRFICTGGRRPHPSRELALFTFTLPADGGPGYLALMEGPMNSRNWRPRPDNELATMINARFSAEGEQLITYTMDCPSCPKKPNIKRTTVARKVLEADDAGKPYIDISKETDL